MIQANPNLKDLITALRGLPEASVRFTFDSTPIKPGYHVTEIKQARVKSLDCGSGTDQWNEIVIQLLDGFTDSEEGDMRGSKFIGIVEAAIVSPELLESSQLYFEFAPGNGPLLKSRIFSIDEQADNIVVALQSERAVCKPFQRSQAGPECGVGCCAPAISQTGCCPSAGGVSGSSCCG